ncbi:hypothetical protein [Bradyrhizobium guangdongense]|uniref:Uncharacterized protein n=1 Tax=Bradyrhizobium guangdongense TaxID=1325090 RepID=A0A410V4I9_9BRAD|nr:hypothetical protein [Bradyrhizobium guangdongense]QAU38603.1 hypothetical protein X265_13680 [Bradyrhizobium guangdongense]QOZ59662.1 hypothetical protein XH86_13685 [Bradyrhizobium guangdongense]GGI29164.1 hypothetical protein GCM10010987_53030 [Bradyrhizobium guangdongense]
MAEQIDPVVESEARRVASEMGMPVLTDAEWDVFFGRRVGVLSLQASNKMMAAYAAAQAIAQREN